jgi:hypothetical protein
VRRVGRARRPRRARRHGSRTNPPGRALRRHAPRCHGWCRFRNMPPAGTSVTVCRATDGTARSAPRLAMVGEGGAEVGHGALDSVVAPASVTRRGGIPFLAAAMSYGPDPGASAGSQSRAPVAMWAKFQRWMEGRPDVLATLILRAARTPPAARRPHGSVARPGGWQDGRPGWRGAGRRLARCS